MANDQIHPKSGNPLQTFLGRRAATEQDQYRPLKQLSDWFKTPAAVTA